MSDKSSTWGPFLLGLLTGAVAKNDFFELKGVIETDTGHALRAVDKDGDSMLISVVVVVEKEEDLLPKNPNEEPG